MTGGDDALLAVSPRNSQTARRSPRCLPCLDGQLALGASTVECATVVHGEGALRWPRRERWDESRIRRTAAEAAAGSRVKQSDV